jgi:probable HAF family extracellular repeat protein
MNIRTSCLAAAILAFASFSPLKAQNYTFQVVDFCDGYTIFPNAINDAGAIVGAAQTATSVDSLAFVYQNGAARL